MTDNDIAILGYYEGQVFLLDAYSTGHYLPPDDTSFGGEYSYDIISIDLLDGVTIAEFYRNQTSNEKYDKTILPNDTQEFSFAWTDEGFHAQNYEVGEIKYGETQETSSFDKYDKYRDNWYHVHKTMMTIAWIVLIHMSVITARYFKWFPYWIYIHVTLNLTVVIMTVIAAMGVFQVNKNIYFAYTSDQRYHSIAGLNMNCIMMFQSIVGMTMRYFINTKKTATPIIFLRRFHQFTGFLLVLYGTANAWRGWKMYDEDKRSVLAMVYAFIFLIYIVCEVTRILYTRYPEFRERYWSASTDYIPVQGGDSVIKAHNKIISSGRSQVIFENVIIDLEKFIPSHPGGAFMLKSVIGQEVGKYICGSASLPGFNPHEHQLVAYTIIKTLPSEYIGFDTDIFQGSASQDRMIWTVSDIFKISECTYCLTLTSESFSVNFPKGTSWLGKSLIITSDEFLNTRRYYSIVLSSLNKWEETESNSIRIYVKGYKNGKVSGYLSEITPGIGLLARGPVGLGLMIKKLKQGNYFIFAAGTGINPFIDLMKIIWNGEAPEGFFLNFFISFKNDDEAYGIDVFRKVEKKCSDKVKLHLYLNTNRDGKFCELDQLNEMFAKGDLRKVWVCGPVEYCQFITDMCMDCGISQTIVQVL